ncbi:hypothetical protein GQ53DRAFT_731750 [Thozetella sp. PMI_491]|nr:hypothetical protein GQ53DRAFT_731750 [Thozetella sp. PMI_491]
MDNKRKAGGSKNGDRDNKRRKTDSTRGNDDLSNGETGETTTHYGLTFLQMLRNTQDKSGRRIAGYFENLPFKPKNEGYYKKIQMPISLKMIERHLNKGDFTTLAELESYVKRMVTNAKEYHNKNSQEYEDAERIRKAASNYMTKHNPAYKNVQSYTAQATPIPAEPEAEFLEEIEQQGSTPPTADLGGDENDDRDEANGDDDEEGEEDEEGGDDDDEDDADGDEDEEDEDEDEEEDDDDDVAPRRSRSGRIVINVNKAQSSKSSKWQYEDVPYHSLSFQKAQEKLLEELLRKEDEDGDPAFVNFINLPSRQFKEYYSVISDPISLTGLQKQVMGKRGRHPPTGKTEFHSWSSFEENAARLWENAHYFNEEGSDVYEEATRLKDQFYVEFEKAKAVAEPQQAKIKLKVSSGQESAASRKVSINVGSASASPAPPTGRSIESQPTADAPVNGTPSRTLRVASGPIAHPAVSQARSMSGSINSPSPAPALPVDARQSPALAQMPNGNAAGLQNGHNPVQPVQNGFHPPPIVKRNPKMWEDRKRAPGKGLADALIEKVTVRARTGKPGDLFTGVIPASPTDAQQSDVFHIPPGHHHMQLIVQLAPLEQQRRQYKLIVRWQHKTVLSPAMVNPTAEDPLPPNALVFNLQLQPTDNFLEVKVAAALPQGQKLPGGEDSESESFEINAYLRHP